MLQVAARRDGVSERRAGHGEVVVQSTQGSVALWGSGSEWSWARARSRGEDRRWGGARDAAMAVSAHDGMALQAR